jgi:hypothetical protein
MFLVQKEFKTYFFHKVAFILCSRTQNYYGEEIAILEKL